MPPNNSQPYDILMDFELGASPAGTVQAGEVTPGDSSSVSLNGSHMKIVTASNINGNSITMPTGWTKLLRIATVTGDTSNTNDTRYINSIAPYDAAETDFEVVGQQFHYAHHYDGQDYTYAHGIYIASSALDASDPSDGGWATNPGNSAVAVAGPKFAIKHAEYGHDDGYIDGAYPGYNPYYDGTAANGPAPFYWSQSVPIGGGPGGFLHGGSVVRNRGYSGHNAFGLAIGQNRDNFTQFDATKPRAWNSGGSTQTSDWTQPHFAVASSDHTPYWYVTTGFGDCTTTDGSTLGGTQQWVLRPVVKDEMMWFVTRWLKYDYSGDTGDQTPGIVQVWAIRESERVSYGNATTASASTPLVWHVGTTNQWCEPADSSVWSASDVWSRRPSGNPMNAPRYMRKRPTYGLPCMNYYVSGAGPTATFPTYHTGMRRRTTTAKAFGDLYGTQAGGVVPTANTVVPTITGTKTQGQTLTGADGTWTGTPSPTVSSRQWLRCDANGAAAVNISGATATTYVLTAADINSTLRFRVTETNSGGTATATSVQTSVVAAAASLTTPTCGTAVTAKSSGADTRTATVTIGSSTKGVVAFVADNYTTAVSGVTCGGYTMTLAQADINNGNGAGVTVFKLANQGAGTFPAVGTADVVASYSSTRTSILTAVPINDCDVSAMLGTFVSSVGYGNARTVTCNSTSGDMVLLFASAKHSASNGTPTEGASQTLVSLDEVTIGGYYTCGLVASKTASASTTAMSLTLAPTPSEGSSLAAVTVLSTVNQASPVISTAPAVTGTATAGLTLTSDHGTWNNVDGSTVYSYQWYTVLIGAPQPVTAISGATATTYVIRSSDVGFQLKCVVTATTTAGVASADSNLTVPVAAAVSGVAPTNSVIPAITGTATSGNQLTASTGTWANTPTGYSYQWNAAGVAINGAIGNAYTLTDTQVGSTITVTVTASNATGSASASSSATASVAGLVPTNSALPAVAGSVIVGQVLTCDGGTWTHSPALTYQWQRTDANGANAANISSATSQTYTLVTADLSVRVQCKVTATNSTGNANATSSYTGLVIANSGRALSGGRGVRAVGGTRVVGGSKTAGGGGL